MCRTNNVKISLSPRLTKPKLLDPKNKTNELLKNIKTFLWRFPYNKPHIKKII